MTVDRDTSSLPRTVTEVEALLTRHGYVADRQIATAVLLALTLPKPLLIEGPAGVGKTEIAKVLAAALGTRLIRLQCYEGLDAHTALYEWNYPKQMLRLKLEESGDRSLTERERTIFSEDFLLERPLLAALRQRDRSPVLLIDELDRADTEFDAFLLEVLADFQVTIPELGTIRAEHPPHVIITSNRTRELSDALRRRCLYLWIDYPTLEKEMAILRTRLPGIDAELSRQISHFMQRVRQLDLDKPPGTAETLDWARSLLTLGLDGDDRQAMLDALGAIAKTRPDLERLRQAASDGTLPLPGSSIDTAST
ncbi:MAG TPA: MoxR family ATPase, partial [Bacillota bacterium]